MKNEKNKREKISLKEKIKDKKERAKIELIFYGVFFVAVIVFARVLGNANNNIQDNNKDLNSFIYSINDNYEYDIILDINDEIYHYYGRVIGNNSTINLEEDNIVKNYRLIDKKYYALNNGNYILTNSDEVYPYIDYRHFDINIIKEYLKAATKDNNTYILKLKDIIINNESEKYITIKIEEGDKNIVIDYTNLFEEFDKTLNKVVVNITYSNIGNIISLEE